MALGALLDVVAGGPGLQNTTAGTLTASAVSDLVWWVGAAGLAWWQLITSDAAREGAGTREGGRSRPPAPVAA